MKDQENQNSGGVTTESLNSQGNDSQHTPGPWVIQKLDHARGELWLQIGLATGLGPIAGIVGDDTAEPTFKPVAGMKYLVTPEAEQWANARLIAAAPALYEAAKYAIWIMSDDDPFYRHDGVIKKLRAALALVDTQPTASASALSTTKDD